MLRCKQCVLADLERAALQKEAETLRSGTVAAQVLQRGKRIVDTNSLIGILKYYFQNLFSNIGR